MFFVTLIDVPLEYRLHEQQQLRYPHSTVLKNKKEEKVCIFVFLYSEVCDQHSATDLK